jgi:hypothetical protein
MVDTWRGHDLTGELIFLPCEGSLEDVEQPDIIFSPVARVPSEDDEEGLVEEHGMAVALSRRGSFRANFDNFPDWAEL